MSAPPVAVSPSRFLKKQRNKSKEMVGGEKDPAEIALVIENELPVPLEG